MRREKTKNKRKSYAHIDMRECRKTKFIITDARQDPKTRNAFAFSRQSGTHIQGRPAAPFASGRPYFQPKKRLWAISLPSIESEFLYTDDEFGIKASNLSIVFKPKYFLYSVVRQLFNGQPSDVPYYSVHTEGYTLRSHLVDRQARQRRTTILPKLY
jgi:hypothetical protein